MSEKQFEFTVIIPVYNVEKYLAQTIDSVIGQSVGFEDNIQLILVNDGSTDDSGMICSEYRERYPDNIFYIDKENGGVSSARNAAIPHIRGRYVNFLDGDDIWDIDAFSFVKGCFDRHYYETDVVGCRKEFFGAKTGYHYLDYKFESSRVIDLKKDFDCIQLDVTGAFIKAEAIGRLRFTEKLKFGEDARFVTSLLMDKCTLGVCREAVHKYRKRTDGSSALQNDIKSLSYYFDTPKYYLRGLLEESAEKHGRPEAFVQYTVMYELGWRLRKKGIREYLTRQQYEDYCGIISELICEIDDRIIKAQRNLWKKHKVYCLMKKHRMDGAAELFAKLAGLETVFNS